MARSFISVVAIACMAFSSACSSSRMILLSDQQKLTATTFSKWRRLDGRAVPLEYEIRRSEYLVALRVFENGSAGLAVQPRDFVGRNLELKSDQPFMDAINVGLASDSWPVGHRYWVLPAWVSGRPFQFSVFSPTGRVLGHEELSYAQVRVMAWGS